VLAPDAVKFTLSPEQIEVLDGVMLTEEELLTVTVIVAAGLVHPFVVPTTE
jgi:hypothetical protein